MSEKLTIIWSEFAVTQLDLIYEYYLFEANKKVAKKIVREIIMAPKRLVKKPNLGQVEEFLKGRQIEYRYLVINQYKLIYSVNETEGFIKIADVFDTRQYPKKMKRAL